MQAATHPRRQARKRSTRTKSNQALIASPRALDPFGLYSGPRDRSQVQSKAVMKKRLLEASRRRCSYCAAPLTLETVTIDHVYPQQFSGPDVFENFAAACGDCNSAKGSLRPAEWFQARPILAAGFLLVARHVSAHYLLEAALVLEALDSPYSEGPQIPIPRLLRSRMPELRRLIAESLASHPAA